MKEERCFLILHRKHWTQIQKVFIVAPSNACGGSFFCLCVSVPQAMDTDSEICPSGMSIESMTDSDAAVPTSATSCSLCSSHPDQDEAFNLMFVKLNLDAS